MTGLATRVSVWCGVSFLRALSLSVVLCCFCFHNAYGTEPLLNTLRTEQVVIVTAKEWGSTTGSLVAFERHQGEWKRTEISGPANLGRTGLIWGEGLHPKQPGRQKMKATARAQRGSLGLESRLVTNRHWRPRCRTKR